MSLFLLRAGMRTGNGQLYYSGMEFASLYAFANGHVNYQLITTFELYLIKVAPPEVREFIFKFLFWENKKQKESSLCGEGLDYRLEEYNKKFKVYLHVLFPTFEDWVTVCSNTPVLDKMDGAQKKDYNTSRTSGEVRFPDYSSRVKHCRTKIRALQQLAPEKSSGLLNLQNEEVNIKSLDLLTSCQESQKTYLKNITTVSSFVKAPTPDSSEFKKMFSSK